MGENKVYHFTEGKKGFPVSVTDTGKRVLLDKDKNYAVKAGEDWECSIKFEDAGKVVVCPIMRIKTVTQNEKEFEDKLQQLKSKFGGERSKN